ncbi:MAG TPA: hypothetical protein VKS79_09485 [Gemmataceae bacterium]|nr:hypothetical protein [Gemmataceae bacterium]
MEFLNSFLQLVHALAEFLRVLLIPVLAFLPYLLWFIYCLFAVNWKKLAPTLREGGWLPATLLCILLALVWSQIVPMPVRLFGFMHLGNFWWQAVAVALWACLGLFAGWLQQRYSWTPREIAVEPPPLEHGHGHGHGHGHH